MSGKDDDARSVSMLEKIAKLMSPYHYRDGSTIIDTISRIIQERITSIDILRRWFEHDQCVASIGDPDLGQEIEDFLKKDSVMLPSVGKEVTEGGQDLPPHYDILREFEERGWVVRSSKRRCAYLMRRKSRQVVDLWIEHGSVCMDVSGNTTVKLDGNEILLIVRLIASTQSDSNEG